MSKKERKTTSSKNDNGSDDSLKVEKHSDSQDRDDSEFIGLRIQTLKDRTRFLREPFEQDKLCYKTAFYLAEPGKHDITDYHQQPMKSENYPNSKKKHKLTNDDIYQDNNLQRGDPCLFFLKTDSTATKIYEEYYSSRSLFLLCSMRPLITSPRVFLTTKDGKPHILSEFIISNSGQRENYQYRDIPMFPYLSAIMLCKNERDVNPQNYLLRTKITVTKDRVETHIPIAVRIDHGSESKSGKYNPFTNRTAVKPSVESLFTMTSIFENDLEIKYGDVSWEKYQLLNYKISLLDHLRRDEHGMLKIKDELNYILFMRGICDFISVPKELLKICYTQDSPGTKLSQNLMNDFLATQHQARDFFPAR